MRVWCVVVVIAGCYHEPDYGNTHFKCGPDLGCPSNQTCVAGFCEGGAADARIRPDSTPPTMGGVVCHTQTCATGLFCCEDSGAYSCVADDLLCDYSLRCDAVGTPECEPGDQCCWDDTWDYGSCRPAASACSKPVCDSDGDCTTANPHCCPSTKYAWKVCQATCT